ncbi:hypothetical protein BH09BAC5_BH09BAC5_11390 [soil metagenome]
MKIKKVFISLAVIALSVFLPFACKTTKVTIDCSGTESSYSKDIAPMITANCMPCHKAGSMKGDWTTYAGLKTSVDNGSFEKHVLVKKDMPPKKPLTEDDVKKIRCWLKNGSQNN